MTQIARRTPIIPIMRVSISLSRMKDPNDLRGAGSSGVSKWVRAVSTTLIKSPDYARRDALRPRKPGAQCLIDFASVIGQAHGPTVPPVEQRSSAEIQFASTTSWRFSWVIGTGVSRTLVRIVSAPDSLFV